MRNRPTLQIAFSLLALTAASCGGDDDADPAAETSTVAATETTAHDMDMNAPMEAAVEIADFAFGPAEITIAAGGTVTWTNTDSQAHTATSAGNFDTGSIDPDGTASVTFDEPGTFTYICSLHPFMTATVTVV